MGVFDNETMTFINQTDQRADAFLFGRRTYELFAGYWGAEERARAAVDDPGQPPDRSCLEHEAQVPRIDHAHRTALGEHDPPLR
jgi:hypothetical protein